MFTNIGSLLIDKDSRAFRIILIQFSCACPTVISSICGKSFHFPFPYFVIFVLRYFLSMLSVHSSGYTISTFSYLESITQSAGGEIYEVVGSSMSMGARCEIGNKASEGQAPGVYGAGFAVDLHQE